MKKNKILNKIITGFLSFAMVITGAMSLSTIKKHTASAEDTVIHGQLLEDPLVYIFAYDMVMDMDFHDGMDSCFIIDSAFLLGASIAETTESLTVENGILCGFLLGFKEGLIERFISDEPGFDPEGYSLADLLDLVQMRLFVHEHGTRYYYDLQTGNRCPLPIGNKAALMTFTQLNIETNPYYAALIYPYSSSYYNILESLQSQKLFSVYMYATEDVTLSGTGLTMKCYLGFGNFTPGCDWEN